MISVIITDYNDHEECNATVRSVRQTAGDKPEVIVIDDGSPAPLRLEDKLSHVWRVPQRLGVGPARHYAACRATRDWILIVDSHMRFSPGWYEAACAVMQSRSQRTLWCCQCVNLTPRDMDMTRGHGKYYGARMLFTGPDDNAPGKWQVLEGKWIPDPGGDGYELSCIMGASYLMHRDWFFQIGGLRLLRQWGSDEPYLALRSWMMGGECRFTKAVQIGHQFRERAFHKNATSSLVFNKLLIAHTCLPDYARAPLLRDISKQYTLAGDVAAAERMVGERYPEIECERAFMESMQTMPIEAFCEKFKIARFW